MADLQVSNHVDTMWTDQGNSAGYTFNITSADMFEPTPDGYQRYNVDMLTIDHKASDQTVSLGFVAESKKLVLVSHVMGSYMLTSKAMSPDINSMEAHYYQHAKDLNVNLSRDTGFDKLGQCTYDDYIRDRPDLYIDHVNEQNVMRLFKQNVVSNLATMPQSVRKARKKILAYIDANLALSEALPLSPSAALPDATPD